MSGVSRPRGENGDNTMLKTDDRISECFTWVWTDDLYPSEDKVICCCLVDLEFPRLLCISSSSSKKSNCSIKIIINGRFDL